MNDKQFIAKQKMMAKNNPDAEMDMMMEDFQHKKGFGGNGNCPVKFLKREGSCLETHKEEKLDKGPQSNYD